MVGIVGYAKRAGWEIPRPSLQSVGGQTAVEQASDFACELSEIALGVPVFKAAWSIWYSLAGSPGQVTPPTKLES